MRLLKLPAQKDPQLTKFYLSLAAVAVAIPLALNSKVPTQASPPAPSSVQLASRTLTPQAPIMPNLSHLTAPSNSLIDDNTYQIKLDTGQTTRGTVQQMR